MSSLLIIILFHFLNDLLVIIFYFTQIPIIHLITNTISICYLKINLNINLQIIPTNFLFLYLTLFLYYLYNFIIDDYTTYLIFILQHFLNDLLVIIFYFTQIPIIHLITNTISIRYSKINQNVN